MEYTVEQIENWIKENNEELNKDRLACEMPEVQMMNKFAPEKSKDVWDAGCWLSEILESLGATEEENKEICFAMGQRCFLGDANSVAVKFANEYATTGTTKDKPGLRLADEINKEVFGL
jgi:hypothetical protein